MTRRTTAAAVLLGLLGAVLGVVLLARVDVDAGPLRVSAQLEPAWQGETTITAGALGSATLDTHRGPLGLVVKAEALDSRSVASLAAGRGARSIAEVDEAALRHGAIRLGLLALVGAAGGGALAAGAVLRRWWAAAMGAASGAMLVLAVGTVALTTVDTEAWRAPRLDGVLALVPSTASDFLQRNDDLGSRLSSLASGIAVLHERALDSAVSEGASPTGGVRILVISDLHLNRAGFRLARGLAETYRADAVINLGDDTDWGSAQESAFLRGIATFDVPYLWVRGNHDSLTTQGVVADSGAEVLDGEAAEVAGLRFYGIGDPTFTPRKAQEVIDEGETEFKQNWSAETFLPSYRQELSPAEPIDVMLVHDVAMVDAFGPADLPPLVLYGHGHRFRNEVRDGTRLIEMGSTGGAGLRAFDDPDDVTPLMAGLLTFDPVTRQATALDLFTLEPYRDSEFSVQRLALTVPEP